MNLHVKSSSDKITIVAEIMSATGEIYNEHRPQTYAEIEMKINKRTKGKAISFLMLNLILSPARRYAIEKLTNDPAKNKISIFNPEK